MEKARLEQERILLESQKQLEKIKNDMKKYLKR